MCGWAVLGLGWVGEVVRRQVELGRFGLGWVWLGWLGWLVALVGLPKNKKQKQKQKHERVI